MRFAEDWREPLAVDAFEFIGVKSLKARGKRLTTFPIAEIVELEPAEIEEQIVAEDVDAPAESLEDEQAPETEPIRSDEDIRDEINGQRRLFD